MVVSAWPWLQLPASGSVRSWLRPMTSGSDTLRDSQSWCERRQESVTLWHEWCESDIMTKYSFLSRVCHTSTRPGDCHEAEDTEDGWPGDRGTLGWVAKLGITYFICSISPTELIAWKIANKQSLSIFDKVHHYPKCYMSHNSNPEESLGFDIIISILMSPSVTLTPHSRHDMRTLTPGWNV